MFTGTQVRHLREDIGLNGQQFAKILGVHPTSLYRWEGAVDRKVNVAPRQLQLLVVLEKEMRKRKSTEAREEFAQSIITGLLLRGDLFALFKILKTVFEDEDDTRDGSVSNESNDGRANDGKNQTML